ncbi:uncharacterized protein LOC122905469 [Neovison vison]|uniref:uncharacterized protein LOC122905469 n=1 Tax=Neovison vison TaxID=452646 RepID=UPI001CF003A5|nr:uncharacterized protein LOC122905469 [Neogale vison]
MKNYRFTQLIGQLLRLTWELYNPGQSGGLGGGGSGPAETSNTQIIKERGPRRWVTLPPGFLLAQISIQSTRTKKAQENGEGEGHRLLTSKGDKHCSKKKRETELQEDSREESESAGSGRRGLARKGSGRSLRQGASQGDAGPRSGMGTPAPVQGVRQGNLLRINLRQFMNKILSLLASGLEFHCALSCLQLADCRAGNSLASAIA